jgi:hypothetical protein
MPETGGTIFGHYTLRAAGTGGPLGRSADCQISEDMARRILQVGLDARMENPEQRPFAPGFLQGIAARRAESLWRSNVVSPSIDLSASSRRAFR